MKGAFIGLSLLVGGCISGSPCVMGEWDKYNCMPIESYVNYNQCIGKCEVELTPKSKPYKPKQWIRPRPYRP